MRASSLTQRIGSAAVMLPLALMVAWWSRWSLALAMALLVVVGVLELYGAFQHAGFAPLRPLGIALALTLFAAQLVEHLLDIRLAGLALTLCIMVLLVAALPIHDRKGLLPDLGLTLLGALYMSALAAPVVFLREIETPLNPTLISQLGMAPGTAWVYLICAVTWLQDTLAYFVGKSFGRHKMTPTLSPKKTWEGAAGGMAGAVLGGVLSVVLFGLPIPIWVGALLGVAGGIVGPLGDLAESMVKRQAGVKDAGHLIPGHGGLLDRVDSFLFTAPALYLLITLLVLR